MFISSKTKYLGAPWPSQHVQVTIILTVLYFDIFYHWVSGKTLSKYQENWGLVPASSTMNWWLYVITEGFWAWVSSSVRMRPGCKLICMQGCVIEKAWNWVRSYLDSESPFSLFSTLWLHESRSVGKPVSHLWNGHVLVCCRATHNSYLTSVLGSGAAF